MTPRLLPCLVLLAAGCVDVPHDEVGTTTGEVGVTWTNLVGVTASGNDLSKTDATSAWNAGAVSVETLASDGYVEFTVGETDTNKAAGLSNGDGGQHYSDIDFALRFTANGAVQVYEGGVLRGGFGSYQAGDRFRVEVKGGVVRYSRSGGTPFYTSQGTPGFPLGVDAAFYTSGASLTEFDLVTPPLSWHNLVRVTASDDGLSLTKTSGTTGWNAGASSTITLSGDGYVEFVAPDNATSKAAGLSNGDSDPSLPDIDYAIRLALNGAFHVHEAGDLIGTFGDYIAGDRFRVEVSGGVVSYSANGGLPFYTSAVPPSFPLGIDTSFSSPGATLTDLALVEAANGCPAYDGTGLVCTGSFVVNDAVDLEEIASCANITGNLTITAPSLTVIALPVLERIGGDLTVTGNPYMTRLRLTQLKEIGGTTLLEATTARTVAMDLSHLRTSGRLETRMFGGVKASFPCLDTSGTVYATEWNGSRLTNSRIHVPRLRRVIGSSFISARMTAPLLESVSGSIIDGTIVAPILTSVGGDVSNPYVDAPKATLDAPRLTDVGGTVFYNAGHNLPALQRAGALILMDAPVIDLPSLLEIENRLEGGSISGSCIDEPAATVLDLPALQRVGAIELCWNGLQQVWLPALETITGPAASGAVVYIRSTGVTDPIELPALTLVKGGDLVTYVQLSLPALTEVRGSVYLDEQLSVPALVNIRGSLHVDGPLSAPALADVRGNLRLLDFSGPVSLPSLASVGGIKCPRGLVTSLDLPALAQVTPVSGGSGSIAVNACRMTSISAPLLQSIAGSLSVTRNGELTSIDLSSLISVGPLLEIFENRDLPNCYATGIHEQLVANGWTGTASIFDNDETGSCP